VNLILVVGFIACISGPSFLSDFTLLGRFAATAGFVFVRQTFVRRSQNRVA
jgi:hypothetical protein